MYLMEEPPCDDYELVDDIVRQACREYLRIDRPTKRFEDLYDYMFELIRENLYQYTNEE